MPPPQSAAASAWRYPRKTSTLPEFYRSIAIPRGASVARKMFAFAGPGYLVAVAYMEALIVSQMLVIGGCFVYEIALSHPDWRKVALGFVPSPEIVTNPAMLYVAIGILGHSCWCCRR